MKNTIFTLLILIGSSCYAHNTTYLENSILPNALKLKINAILNEKCHSIQSSEEVVTVPFRVKVEDGLVDTFFETTFKTIWYFDGNRPIMTQIVVKSADVAVYDNESDRYPIFDVINTDGACE